MLNELIYHYNSFAFFDSADVESNESKIHYASFSVIKMSVHVCRFCNVEFYFNNKLHQHLFNCRKKYKNSISIDFVKNFHKYFTNALNVSIIEFIVKHENKIEYQFRK